MQTLELLLAGVPRKEIADRLVIAQQTVDHNIERLMHRWHAADARILVALVWTERYRALEERLMARIAVLERERDDCLAQHGRLERRRPRTTTIDVIGPPR